MDEWSGPTLMGNVVAEQGPDTEVLSLGRQWHISNQGWVRLLASETPRGGLPSPGYQLPVALPADHNLTFMVMPQLPYFLPYLQSVYPGGVTTPVVDKGEWLFTLYRVSKEQRSALEGVLAVPSQATPVTVRAFGDAPPGWTTYPSPMRWTAMWRVPQYWNYGLRIGPGPARLAIDGKTILTVPAGGGIESTEVALAQGDHFVDYQGTLVGPGKGALLEWSPVQRLDQAQSRNWGSIPIARLRAAPQGPDGLFGVVTSKGLPEQHRLDGTLATDSLLRQTGILDRPFTTTWRATLHAPASGVYTMGMFTQGALDLRIDGRVVVHSDGPRDEPVDGQVDLQTGDHAVEVVYEVQAGNGGLEWIWTPPGGERSIVPRSVLTPPPGAGVGPPLSADVLTSVPMMPIEAAIEIAP